MKLLWGLQQQLASLLHLLLTGPVWNSAKAVAALWGLAGCSPRKATSMAQSATAL